MRRRRWRLGPGVLALALAAASVAARAADMAPPAPSYYPPAAPMPPAIYDWTGIYAGGHIGAGLIEDQYSQSLTTAATTDLIGNTNISTGGIIGGAQVGLNYEFASWVVGVEASWTGTDISGSTSTAVTGGPFAADHERSTSNPQWLAAATGRLGYAFNTVLVYAKGGGAIMDVNYTQDQLAAGVTNFSQTIGDHRSGYTVGGGIEYGMTENLSAKLEYDFYDFGSKNYAFTATPVSISSNLHAITVGLNYRYNWANGTAFERCPTC